MRLHLDPRLAGPVAWEESLDFDPEEIGSGSLLGLDPVHCNGRLRRVEASFLVDMKIDYGQEVACTRCLEPIHDSVSMASEWLVIIDEEQSSERDEIELEEDDLNVVRVRGEFLDTEPLIRQEVVLQIPMKPLCAKDCAGLCPRCGANRNEEPDCCSEETADPRWAALAALRTEDE